MIGIVLALVVHAAPVDAEAALEAAQRCARRADHACAAREARRAIDAADPIIAREARQVLAVALALATPAAPDVAPPTATVEAFIALLDVYPAWRPPPDADPRVASAFTVARRERMRLRLPTSLELGPVPEPPRPGPEVLAPLLPPARFHVPTIERGPPTLSVSLGAGPGIPSDARVGVGLHAAVDVRWLATDLVALWIQGTLALLPIDDALLVEPGHGRGLTAYTAVVGAELRLEVAPDVEVFGAAGVGVGGFGWDAPDQATGLALAASLGARWHVDDNLAVRVDGAPVVVFGGGDVGAGGHVAIMLRGETRF
ncbi:MAG: hypothetical protein IT385_21035 [Deltaproteobacteria bacterium]|nr:hypothetical protein [Deltaproteobacteria bacterium]